MGVPITETFVFPLQHENTLMLRQLARRFDVPFAFAVGAAAQLGCDLLKRDPDAFVDGLKVLPDPRG